MDSTQTTNPKAEEQQEVIEDIFTAIGAKDLTDDDKAKLFVKMIESVQIRTIGKIFETLDQDKKLELEKIIEEEEAPEMDRFLDDNVPNYEEIFASEAKKLQLELIKEFAV